MNKTLELYLHRKALRDTYTIGDLYVLDTPYITSNGLKKLCNTLEDKDRGLSQSKSLLENKSLKVYGKTAIPTGRYRVVTQIWTKYKMRVPVLLNVPAFTGILIHNGTTDKDTLGCVLVGNNTVVGKLFNGKKYVKQLVDIIDEATRLGVEVYITIDYNKPVVTKSTSTTVKIKNNFGLKDITASK